MRRKHYLQNPTSTRLTPLPYHPRLVVAASLALLPCNFLSSPVQYVQPMQYVLVRETVPCRYACSLRDIIGLAVRTVKEVEPVLGGYISTEKKNVGILFHYRSNIIRTRKKMHSMDGV